MILFQQRLPVLVMKKVNPLFYPARIADLLEFQFIIADGEISVIRIGKSRIQSGISTCIILRATVGAGRKVRSVKIIVIAHRLNRGRRLIGIIALCVGDNIFSERNLIISQSYI